MYCTTMSSSIFFKITTSKFTIICFYKNSSTAVRVSSYIISEITIVECSICSFITNMNGSTPLILTIIK
ncbi:hypothetical protein MBBTH_03910 [Methanobrevibacter thaueri]|uniref:Uncharacterized protein n=1 Tax=Methanobrevibacter thaueri TaxID=190975 RepID=A0A315XPK9_9EURY|nr:hypothetical protein MBBTH_03910 [Methanobrevibacter thaueri]